MADVMLSPDGATLTVRVSMEFQQRGGRKVILAPTAGESISPPQPRYDRSLIKAVVRAHRWARTLESQKVQTIKELAERDGVTDAYICRLLPLTCLAPDIVEAVLSGKQASGAGSVWLSRNFPFNWNEQRQTLSATAGE